MTHRPIKRICTVVTITVGTPLIMAATPPPARAKAVCNNSAARHAVDIAAAAREDELAKLVAAIDKKPDPFGVNASQLAALHDASTGVAATEKQASAMCVRGALAVAATDAHPFSAYRVYWLREPQTYFLAAADSLGSARDKLWNIAESLSADVRSNRKARADLNAMKGLLRAADKRLGAPPTLSPRVATMASLAPAISMASDDAALRAALTDIVEARDLLGAGKLQGDRLVADLRSK